MIVQVVRDVIVAIVLESRVDTGIAFGDEGGDPYRREKTRDGGGVGAHTSVGYHRKFCTAVCRGI